MHHLFIFNLFFVYSASFDSVESWPHWQGLLPKEDTATHYKGRENLQPIRTGYLSRVTLLGWGPGNGGQKSPTSTEAAQSWQGFADFWRVPGGHGGKTAMKTEVINIKCFALRSCKHLLQNNEDSHEDKKKKILLESP